MVVEAGKGSKLAARWTVGVPFVTLNSYLFEQGYTGMENDVCERPFTFRVHILRKRSFCAPVSSVVHSFRLTSIGVTRSLACFPVDYVLPQSYSTALSLVAMRRTQTQCRS